MNNIQDTHSKPEVERLLLRFENFSEPIHNSNNHKQLTEARNKRISSANQGRAIPLRASRVSASEFESKFLCSRQLSNGLRSALNFQIFIVVLLGFYLSTTINNRSSEPQARTKIIPFGLTANIA